MAKKMKTKLRKSSPVQLPDDWVKFLRKERETTGVAMWRIVTSALEEKFKGRKEVVSS